MSDTSSSAFCVTDIPYSSGFLSFSSLDSFRSSPKQNSTLSRFVQDLLRPRLRSDLKYIPACACVNYPPLMRGIPRLEVGASAPWSFSFPAYEESSLQDDCNHPNLTISTGDPRRPVRFIHNEGLSFLCVRMSGCACHPFRLIQDILCCLLVPVHGMSAHRAEIRPVRQL